MFIFPQVLLKISGVKSSFDDDVEPAASTLADELTEVWSCEHHFG